MSTQNTITTVVDPIVSARVGNDTFFSSVTHITEELL